ncbi:MAG: TIM barrel protein [Chloroflexota bacterium]|nr:TIM barrel protein [Chloroflexota bacterium]
MELHVFRALWGMTGSFQAQIEAIADAGYDGVEGFMSASDLDAAAYSALVASHHLKLIMAAQIDTVEQLAPMLTALAAYQPIKIGIHPGRDSMSRDEGARFFEEALRIEQQIGVPVSHETHRGRLFYTPWDTAYYLKQFPELKVVADYSHWVNVCERLPDDQAAALELANQRAFHIHGRVGYEESPQVPDPAAPEYAGHLAWFERHWTQIADARHAAGDTALTFTPEYGPPPYLQTLPYTRQPLSNLWDVCLWGADRARKLFAPLGD